MGKKNTDKKLGRFSTILEIITNLGQILTWVLGVGSAYVLNIQTKPIVVPGIDITLDLGFQFALLISAMLGYIHFLQKFWENNREKLRLSDSFLDFSFWDIPRLKQPLLLIPIVIAFAIFVQVSIKSTTLIWLFSLIILVAVSFIISRFYYHLSPHREYEKLVESWSNDNQWLDKWYARIKKQLNLRVGIRESDLLELGMSGGERDRVEILLALHKYFEKFEFSEDLVLTRVDELSYFHPLHSSRTDELVLLFRKNLSISISDKD